MRLASSQAGRKLVSFWSAGHLWQERFQSAREYCKMFASILVDKMGFKQCPSDPCLFMRKNATGLVIILCYIDDKLCVGDRRAIEEALKEVKSHGLSMTVENQLHV